MASLEIAGKQRDKEKVGRYQKDWAEEKGQKRIHGRGKSIDIPKVSDHNTRGMRIAHGHGDCMCRKSLEIFEDKMGRHANGCCFKHFISNEGPEEKRKVQVYRTHGGMTSNAYHHIGEHDKVTDCYHQQLDNEYAEKLDDNEVTEGAAKNSEIAREKRTVRTIPRNIECTENGNGQCQRTFARSDKCCRKALCEGVEIIHKRKECLDCKCFFISSDDINPSQIVQRLQQSPFMEDNLQKVVISISNNVVTVAKVHGVLVISFNAPVVKVTFSTVSYVDGMGEKHIACQCTRIFTNIEIVLHEENLQFNTVKTCQDNSSMSYGDAFMPTDAQLVAEVESLDMEMCRIKKAVTSQFINGTSKHESKMFATESNNSIDRLNEIWSKEQVEMRSKWQAIFQRISQINEELGTRTNTRPLEVREKKSIEFDKSIEEFFQDDVDAETNSGVQEPTTALGVHYPVQKLLKYFESSLQHQDWDRLRHEMLSYIPENVLCSFQNGNGFFQELLDRGLISDQNMELLRGAFYQIERIDCVHFIDSAKDGQCLLELENAEQAVSGATSEGYNQGDGYNQSVTAVEENRSTTDEVHNLEGATGFQMSSETVEDGTESFAKITESNAVGRSNEEEAQGHETGEKWNGWNRELSRNYENLSSVFQKSFTGPVQEVAAFCSNPLQLRSNEISSQSRSKDSPQEGFDAGKGTDYHLATRRNSQLEKQALPHGECSNDGSTQNEPNHAGSYKDKIWTTGNQIPGSQKGGSQKTEICKSENVDTESCETDNTSNANAVISKNGSRDAEKCKNGSCEAGSNKTGICTDEPNAGASSNPGNFPHKSRRRKKRNAKWSKQVKYSCVHYDRYCDVQFGCCKEFWACHRCHNTDSKCEEKNLRSRDIKNIRCKRCDTVQEFPKEDPSCVECGLIFADYFCAICQHLTGKQSHPYHCIGCGICRVHEDRSFHCDVCGVCLDVKLLENHICRPGSAHDQCCICFEDAFNGCQILPCSHKIHKDCATAMLKNGIRTCPVCRQSFEHKLEYRPIDK